MATDAYNPGNPYSLLGTQSPTPGGRTSTTTSSGKKALPGTGPQQLAGLSSAQVAASVLPEKPPPALKRPKPGAPGGGPHPNVPTKAPFSASNPMMMTQPPPAHQGMGVSPPYPDARSPQPQMTPNGQVVLPMPREYPGMLHVPRTIVQGMTGLLHTRI